MVFALRQTYTHTHTEIYHENKTRNTEKIKENIRMGKDNYTFLAKWDGHRVDGIEGKCNLSVASQQTKNLPLNSRILL